MAKTEAIRARIEPKLKADAESILDDLGLDLSDAIRVSYRQVVLRKGLPFDAWPSPTRRPGEPCASVQEKRSGLTRFEDTKPRCALAKLGY